MTTHWEPPQHSAQRQQSYQLDRPQNYDDFETPLRILLSQFPTWDKEALMDILVVTEKNVDQAVALISQWTAEDASDHLPEDLARVDLSSTGNTVNQDTIQLPTSILHRPSYDVVMAARLERACPKPASLVRVLLAVNIMKKRAHAADNHVKKHNQKRGIGTMLANRPHLHKKNRQQSKSKSPKDSENHPTLHHEDHHNHLTREEAISEGIKLLDERLAFLKLRSIKTVDDGNCQFRSISKELYGSEDYHFAVRKRVIEHMRANRVMFEPYVGDAADFDEYLFAMSKNKTWGDELTLRAAADGFGVEIHIITTEPENYLLTYGPVVTKLSRKLFLSYISPIHYNTVQPL